MPIGKNSLKRVSNNGYSAVKSTAPDMENSVVVTPEEKPAAEPVSTEKVASVSSKKPTTTKKAAAKTTATKGAGTKGGSAKKPATKSASAKTAKKPAAKAAAASAPVIVPPARKRGRPPKNAADKIPTATETARKVAGEKKGFKGYYNIGDDMPIYLL